MDKRTRKERKMNILKIILTTIIIAVTAYTIDVKMLPLVYGYLQRIGMC